MLVLELRLQVSKVLLPIFGDGATVQSEEEEEPGRKDGGEDDGETARGEQVEEVIHKVSCKWLILRVLSRNYQEYVSSSYYIASTPIHVKVLVQG